MPFHGYKDHLLGEQKSLFSVGFLSRFSFVINQCPVVVHPEHSPVTFVTVYDAPYELSEPALEYHLQKYGRIFPSRRSHLQEYPNIHNGLRHLHMTIHTSNPSYIRFRKSGLALGSDHDFVTLDFEFSGLLKRHPGVWKIKIFA